MSDKENDNTLQEATGKAAAETGVAPNLNMSVEVWFES